MAGNNRRLAHGEKALTFYTTEKGRDRAQARRDIEGLNQQDSLIALALRQNELLEYIAETLHRMELRAGTGSPSSAG